MPPDPLSSRNSVDGMEGYEALLKRAGNEIAAVLCECCTVEEIEGTLAEINPEDWKRAAEKALDAANYRGAVEECGKFAEQLEHLAAEDTRLRVWLAEHHPGWLSAYVDYREGGR